MDRVASALCALSLVVAGCDGTHEREPDADVADAGRDASRTSDAAASSDAARTSDGATAIDGARGPDAADVDVGADAASDATDGSAALDACVPFDCGDGACTGPETCVTCETDCGACPCGDGRCEGRETCANCPDDCGGPCPCGDGMCEIARGESCATCAGDCDCACDDFRCGPREWEICPGGSFHDCGFVDFCGNRICDGVHAEDCTNCPWDCCCS